MSDVNREKLARRRRREARIWELSSSGMTQREIASRLAAEDLGPLSQRSVGRILARIETRELARLSKRVEAQKVRQTAQLEHAYREAMQAWERSKEPARRVRRKVTPAPDGSLGEGSIPGEVTTEVRDRDGNPAFLLAAMSALDGIRKVWGLDSPQRRELAGPGGGPVAVESRIGPDAVALRARMAQLRKLSPEQLRQYREILALLKESEGDRSVTDG